MEAVEVSWSEMKEIIDLGGILEVVDISSKAFITARHADLIFLCVLVKNGGADALDYAAWRNNG
jgi:hypothetical protein